MNRAALPSCFGQILGGAFDQAAAGIGDDELYAIEPTIDEVAKERRPAGFVLLSTFANAQNLETLTYYAFGRRFAPTIPSSGS